MIEVLTCLAAEHHPAFLIAALVVCGVGSVVAMRLFARVRRTERATKYWWLLLAGLNAGGTIWSTHFIAMMGFESPIALGYELTPTAVSLVLAIATASLGFLIAASTVRSVLVEVGGGVIGLGIVCMHYVGMSALQVQGDILWSVPYVVASVVFGCGFGVVATNRIARPVTVFCKYGGALGLTLAILSLHFVGMTAMTIVPGPMVGTSEQLVSEEVLAVVVLAVMGVQLLTATAIYMIDLKSSQDATKRYKHLALHDPLTGLPNRAKIESHLDGVIEGQADDTASAVVAVIDLDRFKEVNDVHGHAAGDFLLKTLSERLQTSLRLTEFVGRFGGDEFLAVKYPIYGKGEALEFCERLRALTHTDVDWEESKIALKASVGAALFPDHGVKPGELMERADLAMYRAKERSNRGVEIYDPNVDEESRKRSTLSIDLGKAVENNELEVHYQPQNDTVSRELIGFEALLRWKHPIHGDVAPGIFIPIAEETNLIVELGEWVLRTACAEAASWEKPYKIAVNIAPAQLMLATLPKIAHETLLETGLSASRLELEITESGIIADQSHVLQIVRQLKNLGIKIAMDDFGTGYSSLSTLQNFPFDKIKLDREFIKDTPGNRQSVAIVRSTIILADSLGIPVLAEGVETEDHMEFLQEVGCQSVQGFLFGQPLSTCDVREITGQAPDQPAVERVCRPRATSHTKRTVQAIDAA